MEHGVGNTNTYKEKEDQGEILDHASQVFWPKVLRNTQGDTNVGPDLCSYNPHSI